MDRLEHLLRRWLGTWPAAFLVATVACASTLDTPSDTRMVIAGIGGLWAIVALFLDRRRSRGLERGLAALATGLLLLTLVLTAQGQRAADRPMEFWEDWSLETLDRAEPLAVAELEGLRAAAEARAREALEPDADLGELSRPLSFAGTTLECGVSVWEEDRILAWAGAEPGPDRLGQAGLPLVVDYGFRRVLTLRVDGPDGRSAYCDVALGILGGLLPESGLGPSPGEPLSKMLSVETVVWPQKPLTPEGQPGRRVIGVGGEEPWVWLELRRLQPRLLRTRDLASRSARAAGALLAAMLPALLLLLRDWPDRWPLRGRGSRVISVIVALVVGRITIQHFGLLERLADARHGVLGLLLEPSVFYVSGMGGLIHTAADFLLTAIVLSALAELLLRSWLALVGRDRGARRWLGWLLLCVAGPATALLGTVLQRVVAEASLPVLVGVDSAFFTLPFVVLQLAMLGVLIGPVFWCVEGWRRWSSAGSLRMGGILVASVLGALWTHRFAPGAIVVAVAILPVLGRGLRRLSGSDQFAHRGLAMLVILLWTAGFQSMGLESVYSGIKEEVAVQEARKRLEPEESNLAFLIEDILQGWADDEMLLRRLGDPREDRTNLAFELWARTFLPVQGEGCRLSLRGRDGTVLSEFDISLPYEPTPTRVWRQNTRPGHRVWSVETVELTTEQGPFLVYRGWLDLVSLVPGGDVAQLVIDLPFAAAAGTAPLDRASLSGPELLGLETTGRQLLPRKTFDRAVLIGHLDEHEVVSATESALIGLSRDELPPTGEWGTVSRNGQSYRMGVVERDGRELLVALARPDVFELTLDLSRLAALHLGLVVVALLFLLGMRAIHLLPGKAWPDLLGHAGFQERLLVAMFFVVLAPVLVLGLFQQRRASEQLRADNLSEVSERLEISMQLLASNVDDLATALIDGEYIKRVIATGEPGPPRDVGNYDPSQIMVFSADGELVVDETLREFSAEEAVGFLGQIRGGELLLESTFDAWYLGRAYPVLGPDARTLYVYVRRPVSDEDLGRVARMVSADLSLFDGPWAAVSSQAYLFKAGLRAPALPVAGQPILKGSARRLFDATAAGNLVVAHGYSAISGPGDPQRGVFEARLFGYATEAARERGRAQLFFFGLSSLALVFAMIVGFLFSGRITGPLRGLLVATERVGRGDLDHPVPESGSDEIGVLVRSFNQMTRDLRGSQEELARRRAFLQDMLDAMSAGVLVLDEKLELIEANPAAEELIGEGREAFLGRIDRKYFGDGVRETEVSISRPDGPRTLRSVISPTALPERRRGWLVVFDDVTELLASRRLTLYAQMARQVAHEVKNPLTPIQLSAQMIRQAVDDDHPRWRELVDENVEQIEAQVGRLRTIASEFSLLGREELGDLEPLDLQPLLQEVRSLYPSLDGTFQVVSEVDHALPVHASRNALLKILTNLVENARQAMGEVGEVCLRGGLEGSKVVVEVLDEGPGIAPEVEGRLFEPYFSTKSTGTGLGLVICRNLVEKMGGSIELTNRIEGRGARARLVFPVAVSESGNDPSSTA